MLFQETYLPAEYLPNLKKYHYSGKDNSILSALFFNKMWNIAVNYLPMNLAPNMITLIGFSLSLGCYLLLMLFTPLMDKAAPSWVYLYMGIAAFSYIHLDALDGKQARRTGSSSPLGQLVDHGCDCINLIFMIFMFWSVFGLEINNILAFYAVLCLAVFISITWEETYTGILYLGQINGPVEGTTILSIASIISAIFGRGIWDTLVFGIPLKTFASGVIGSGSIYAIVESFINALKVAGTNALGDILPSYAILYSAIWLLMQQKELWFHKTFSPYLAMLGFTVSNLVSRIVVNYVTHQPFPRWTAAYLPIIIGCVISILQDYLNFRFNWHYYVLVGFGWVILMQVHYHFVVFKTVSKYLKINILAITPKSNLHVERETNDSSEQNFTPKETLKIRKSSIKTPTHEKTMKLKRVLDTPIRQSPRFKN